MAIRSKKAQPIVNTAAAAVGGVASSFVTGLISGIIPPQYAPAATLVAAGALGATSKNPLLQHAASGMAGVAGAALLGGFLNGNLYAGYVGPNRVATDGSVR